MVDPAELYLDLLKKCLTRTLFPDEYGPVFDVTGGLCSEFRNASFPLGNPIFRMVYPVLQKGLARWGLSLLMRRQVTQESRYSGKDWPLQADTMIGRNRLDHLHWCIKSVLMDRVQGDFIEAGVWRGGACIFMCGALQVYGDLDRQIWMADSFEGMPQPSALQDVGDEHWTMNGYFGVSQEQVARNFAKYDLLNNRVKYIKGWFKDSLPLAPIDRLAILRLDGDLYSSTMESLVYLYPKLSPGGFIIIDDYGDVDGCTAAVTDYRKEHGIETPMSHIEWCGIYWRKDGIK